MPVGIPVGISLTYFGVLRPISTLQEALANQRLMKWNDSNTVDNACLR